MKTSIFKSKDKGILSTSLSSKFNDFTWPTNSITFSLNEADFHIFKKSRCGNNVLKKNLKQPIYTSLKTKSNSSNLVLFLEID